MRNKTVYYISNLSSTFNEEKEGSRYNIVLSDVEQNISSQERSFFAANYSVSGNILQNFLEGGFVYADINDNNEVINLTNANKSKLAKQQFFLNNLYRGLLIKKYNTPPEVSKNNISKVFSYHVNVGHGNCSILVFNENGKVKIWMVDCSNYDFLIHRNYQYNIDDCIKHITAKFKLKKFEVDCFFLTHPHYDHYSGIRTLLNRGFINSHTTFYINFRYSWPESKYTDLLKELELCDIRFVEPITRNGNARINIWYPEISMVRTNPHGRINPFQIVTKVNNISAIYQIILGEKSIVFPGDIETEAWDNVNNCFPHLGKAQYYCLSHHGSLNGHLRNNCNHGGPIHNLYQCAATVRLAILMGRDSAYNGIYSTQVLNDFRRKLVKSEMDQSNNPKRFLEIDWDNNHPSWY